MKKILMHSLLVSLLAMLSCRKDFIVENIEDKSLTIISPANNLVTPNNIVTFWWEELEGAEKYNLQIVKPSFANLTQLVADTSISATKINFNLQPGTYQWRIRATNAGHNTVFQLFNLRVDSSSNLTNQQVSIIAPVTGYLTRNKVVDFSWNALGSATTYSLEVAMNNAVVSNTITSGTTYQYSFPITTAANYTCTWRVKGINATSISQYNPIQTFVIDVLPPAVSTPSLPTNNALIKDTTHLIWNRLGGNDTKKDSLFFYTDAGFVNLAKKAAISTTKIKINLLDGVNPLPIGTSSLNPIQYWWRIKSVDSLGNTSGFSSGLNFNLY